MKTTLIGKQDLLEAMATTLTAPRTKESILRGPSGAPPHRIRVVPVAGPRGASRSRSGSPIRHWNTWEATESRFFEQLVRGALLLSAAGGLLWLAFATLRFFLAWQGLASGLRMAMS